MNSLYAVKFKDEFRLAGVSSNYRSSHKYWHIDGAKPLGLDPSPRAVQGHRGASAGQGEGGLLQRSLIEAHGFHGKMNSPSEASRLEGTLFRLRGASVCLGERGFKAFL